MSEPLLMRQAIVRATGRSRVQPEPIVWEPARLPLRWQMAIDPKDVVVSIYRPGRPRAKGRPRATANGGVYTPPATRRATEDWGWVYRAAMRGHDPVRAPLGMVVHFRMPDRSNVDDDNLLKLVMDAGNKIVWWDDRQFVESHVYMLRGCPEPGTELVVWRR